MWWVNNSPRPTSLYFMHAAAVGEGETFAPHTSELFTLHRYVCIMHVCMYVGLSKNTFLKTQHSTHT